MSTCYIFIFLCCFVCYFVFLYILFYLRIWLLCELCIVELKLLRYFLSFSTWGDNDIVLSAPVAVANLWGQVFSS